MKKNLILFTVILFTVFNVQVASAKIWRVNSNSNYNGTSLWGDNFGGTSAYPVFAQLTNANSSNLVSSGDTLYVEGSTVAYDNVTFTKKLVIIGPGYFLTENSKVSNDVLSANVGQVVFNAGSQGSQLLGINNTSVYGISINVSNILIKRCKIDYSVTVNYNISDISVVQNFFTNANSSNASAIAVSPYGFPTNFIFNNNISKRVLLLAYSATTYTAQQCSHNVFDCPAISGKPSIQLNTGSFKNNILKTPTATVSINGGSNQNVSYNISASSTGQFGTANNNKVVADMSTLFVTSGTSDGIYKLKSGSAGSNNASDGTDRGVFGGTSSTDMYTLSGLAPIPVIYSLTTSGDATPAKGLSVTISAKTIK